MSRTYHEGGGTWLSFRHIDAIYKQGSLEHNIANDFLITLALLRSGTLLKAQLDQGVINLKQSESVSSITGSTVCRLVDYGD